MSLTAAETIDAVGVWLVELTFGGEVHRFATRAVDVVDKSGTSHRYHIGLEDFPHDFSSSGIDLTIGMSIEADEDWAAIAARGVQLERAPAVLRRHFTGQTLERARVIVRGITMDVEYGAVGEPMELSIAMAADEAADTLPPVTSVISADTWPVSNALFDVGVEGAQYNYIIGYPGTLGDGKGAPAVPAPAVDIDSPITTAMRLEVAGHRIESGITVGVWDLTDTIASGTNATSTALADLLGVPVTLVSLGGTGLTPALDRSWYVSFDVTNGGGLMNAEGTTPLRGVGEILQYFCQRHTRIPIDIGRMRSEAARLDRYKVDTFLNSGVNVWEWLQEAVVGLAPVIQLQSSVGLYWKFLDWGATKTDAVAELNADAGQLERVGPVRTLGGPIYNEITVEYAPFATSSRYRKRVVVTAQRDATTAGPPTTADDSRITENIRCRRSQLQYGVKPFTFSTSAVWDDVTAALIAADIANRYALPHRRIQYQGGAQLEALEIGSVVLLTDAEIYIDAEVALVMEITAGGGEDVTLELVMVDNPVNHPRKIT